MNTKKIIFPEDLKTLENEIEKMKEKTKIAAQKITEELANYGVKEMQNIYESFGYLSFGNEPNTFYVDDIEGGGKKVVMEGPQAIYEEFGTGTLGQQSPYPINPKEYGMDGYNSHVIPNGTIRKARKRDVKEALKQGTEIPEGGLFWTYKNNLGATIYTQGTPAQKEGYDSMNKTWDKSKEVIQRITKEVIFND